MAVREFISSAVSPVPSVAVKVWRVSESLPRPALSAEEEEFRRENTSHACDVTARELLLNSRRNVVSGGQRSAEWVVGGGEMSTDYYSLITAIKKGG